ncbi:uncharacterized protein LOC111386548 [Olea europaea var. sylvestris]|uniref:uncharacterized protein LOC111386548 n=1 Tax=Olea europaea var. sylvestris TaxID=158386 RepID=UPI000C1D344D|nr:uncharacterized protein LOC111386548 [Olea europaea var. sylvestris]
MSSSINTLFNPADYPTSHYYLYPSKNPGALIVSEIFNGDNYTFWSHSISMAFSVKNKLGFIDGSLKSPSPSSGVTHNCWVRKSDLVLSWLLNLISKDIRQSLLYTSSAYEPTAAYFSTFIIGSSLCPYASRSELKGPTDTIRPESPYITPVELLTRKSTDMMTRQPHRTFNKPLSWMDKKKPKCTHCGYPNHIADKCFHLIGYPPGWRGLRGLKTLVDTSAAYAISLDQSTEDEGPNISFNLDLFQQFLAFPKTRQIFHESTNTSPQTAATITIGISFYNSTYSKPKTITWLIDIGAIDHMDLASMKMTSFAKEKDGLYHCMIAPDTTEPLPVTSNPTARVSTQFNYNIWHCRIGHISSTRMSKIPCISSYIPCNNLHKCEICPLAKQEKLPFPISNLVSNKIFDLVHCDIWGPFHVPSFNGYRFSPTIVDDYSRCTWVFMMQSKSETHSHIKNFYQMVIAQFNTKIKTFRTDNGTEFFMPEFYNSHGILHQKSCVESPQQNGIVERKHQYILQVAKALLFQSNVPLIF